VPSGGIHRERGFKLGALRSAEAFNRPVSGPFCSLDNCQFLFCSERLYYSNGTKRFKKGESLHGARNVQVTDVDRLSRFEAFSKLPAPELRTLASALALSDFRRYEIMVNDSGLASGANILLRGIARVTCLGAHGERMTVALLAPGPIPEFPSPLISRAGFQCEAYNNCRVGSLSWTDFNRVLAHSSESARKTFHDNDMKQWYRMLMRSASFLHLELHDRIGMTLLELCSEFGIEDTRGTLLRVSFSHKDIASLVGASRPRVTEHLARLEREDFLIRHGRQIIVCVDKLLASLNAQPV